MLYLRENKKDHSSFKEERLQYTPEALLKIRDNMTNFDLPLGSNIPDEARKHIKTQKPSCT